MTEAVGKEIAIEGVDPRELYGPRNTYLDQIKALHPQLRIVARGSSLKVLGSEAETQRFGRHMEGLVAYYLKYGHISSEVIAQAFAGGIAGQEAPADKDVIVYGNNGNIIRARTVNQQKLVSLYGRNDLLFAVGQDLYGHRAGRARVEGEGGAAYHPHASGGRGGRETRVPAG